ncbi:MAG TPA: hypothetical protein VKA26_14735 [Ignavibacteriaceae bacterium]|nr:hypothetical protein [Ignavibacteriaceae bacterium]
MNESNTNTLMIETPEQVYTNFEESLDQFKTATDLTKLQKATSMMSQVEQLSHTHRGLEFLFEKCLELEDAGIFKDTVWEFPQKQVPSLVKGTLLSGHPNSSFEILSELRILSYALGKDGRTHISSNESKSFLEEAVVHNLEFAYDELTEATRLKITPQERRKLVNHFQFLLSKAELNGIKERLVEEIKMICEQRPVVTQNVRNLIQTTYQKLVLDEKSEIDNKLQYYVDAIYFPAPIVKRYQKFGNYKKALARANKETLEIEATVMGNYLHETGLTNPYLAMLLCFLMEKNPVLVNNLLHLNSKGISEWERYRDVARELALKTFSEFNHAGIYGFKGILEKSLFSRRAVRAGLTNLKHISIHPEVERRILKSVMEPSEKVLAKQYLMGAVIGILGQPTGVGQGNNPTCQSARGISMWAQHTPAELINMITIVTSTNNLVLRFENHELESMKLVKGLVGELDHNLDAVSVVLIPHLDKIYNEMMNRSSNRGDDPHRWTNPAFYGSLVPVGFASPYSYLTKRIENFRNFIRLFYNVFHPLYNGGRELVYPIPVGIFITTSKGDMLGFHAVSLLRVAQNKKNNEYRAYFLNPNNEGRQDWGQNIRPSVYDNGEKHGESSLPFYQFIARAYAFHFNNLIAENQNEPVPEEEIEKVEKLAKESWGRSYQWSN